MNWPVARLGEVATITMGQSPPGDTYNSVGDGLPFFQGKAEFGSEHPMVVKWCSAPQRTAEPGDILLSVRAPVGPTNIAADKCCIGRGLAAIRAVAGRANTRFLRYFLQRFETDLVHQGVGSTFSAISRKDIEQMRPPLPPLPEQERIVSILDAAEELRQLRERADRRTADLIPALFHEMFGDPVTNPKGWQQVPLGEVSELQSGGTPSKENPAFWNGPIPWISAKDMKGVEIIGSEDHVSGVALEETSLKMVPEGQVLVVVRGMILAHTLPLSINRIPVTINQDLKAIFPNRRTLEPEYLLWSLKALDQVLLGKVSSAAHGTRKLDIPRLTESLISLPPLSIQQVFATRVAKIQAMEAQQAGSRRRIDDLFQSLLHRAFQGEL